MGIHVTRSSAAQGGGGGTLTHGQEFTVTGSGFGTRGDYGGAADRLNFAWLDFEAALEDDGWNFTDPGHADFWEWMSTGNRTARSSRWAKRFSNGAPSNQQYLRTLASHSTGKFFFSIWHFNTSGANGKTWRIWYDNAAEDLWMNQNPSSYVVNNDEPNGFLNYVELDTFPTGVWTRMDVYMRNGGTGLLIDVWRLGANSNSPIFTKDFNAPFQGVNINPVLGAGEDGPGSSVGWGYDDVYMDFSPARVELTDSAVWANRTKSEIQRPKTWADGSATSYANLGAFTSGETVYPHVVTDNYSIVTPLETFVVA